MSALETPGLLREGTSGGSIVSDETCHGAPLGASDIGYYGGHLVGESITPANRRRLIACWNAFAGVHTEVIEEGAYALMRADRDRLQAERDALLEFARATLGVTGTLGHPEATAEDERRAEARFEASLPAARSLAYPRLYDAINLPAQAAEAGAALDPDSLEQGEPA